MNYLKQSEDHNHVVLLHSYNTKVNADYSKILSVKNLSYSSTVFEKKAFPVNLRIFGQAYYNTYDQFSKIFYTKQNVYKDVISCPLPVAVRVIKNGVYVIERPPFKTNVRLSLKRAYLSKNADESLILCEIWIPWTVSILSLKNDFNSSPSMRMYYNDGPISSLDELLSPSWTPNFHHHNEICLGDTSSRFHREVSEKKIDPNNVQEVYNYLINDYFNGGWNMDLGPGVIQNLCNHNIGKFRKYPLTDPELASRAKDNKLKLKDVDDYSRKSTITKNYYLNWSLLTLAEVLNAVKKYKKSFNEYQNGHYQLSDILKTNERENFDEHEACSMLASQMHENNADSKHWEINLTISPDIINEAISEKHSLKEIGSCSVLQFGNLCASISYDLILKNRQDILPLFYNALDLIADNYLKSNFEEQQSTILIEYGKDAVSLKKESVSL